jgi:hypothetical protein
MSFGLEFSAATSAMSDAGRIDSVLIYVFAISYVAQTLEGVKQAE